MCTSRCYSNKRIYLQHMFFNLAGWFYRSQYVYVYIYIYTYNPCLAHRRVGTLRRCSVCDTSNSMHIPTWDAVAGCALSQRLHISSGMVLYKRRGVQWKLVRFLQRRGGNSASVRVFRFVAVKVGDWASGEGWILPVAKDFEPWMMIRFLGPKSLRCMSCGCLRYRCYFREICGCERIRWVGYACMNRYMRWLGLFCCISWFMI